jgi:hypothetical protein
MAEQVEYQSSLTDGLKEGAGELRKDVTRDKIEERLDGAVSDKPLLKYLLDIRNVLLALLIAAILTLIVSVATSMKLGALVLVVTFVAAWLILAARDYNTRRPTKPVDAGGGE